jgi:hypothetical protein
VKFPWPKSRTWQSSWLFGALYLEKISVVQLLVETLPQAGSYRSSLTTTKGMHSVVE